MSGERKVRPDCVNASNPFHVCADRCARRFPTPTLNIEGAQSPARNGRNVDPDCANASNPFHQCADYCTKKKIESETENSAQNGERVGEDRKNIDPSCVNASNPFHKCGDYCAKKAAGTKNWSGMVKEGCLVGTWVLFGWDAITLLFAILGFLFCAVVCYPTAKAQNGESIKGGAWKMEEGMKVDPTCVHSSDPFHQCSEYCSQRNAEERKSMPLVQNGESFKEEVRKMEDGMKVDSMCVHSSDSFQQCSEYCSQRNSEEGKSMTLGVLLARESEEELASRKNRKEEVVIRANKKVDPRCPNASNPFHECAEYCLRKIGESGRDVSKGSRSGRSEGSESGRSGRSERSKSAYKSKGSLNIVMDKRDVDPRCVNASNPFHKCADYCYERICEST